MKNLRLTRLNLRNKTADFMSNTLFFGNKIQKIDVKLANFYNKIKVFCTPQNRLKFALIHHLIDKRSA